MKYIVNPMELVSPLGTCNCGVNYGNNSCDKCSGYCSTFEICTTPTGAKMSPQGIDPKA